jgi:hypothetical protein
MVGNIAVYLAAGIVAQGSVGTEVDGCPSKRERFL